MISAMSALAFRWSSRSFARGKQMGLFLMVLGFMWWWPLGLIILAALIANGRIGLQPSSRSPRIAEDRQLGCATRMDRMGKKADLVPAKTDGLRDRVQVLARPNKGGAARLPRRLFVPFDRD